jgi:hypothetical protein
MLPQTISRMNKSIPLLFLLLSPLLGLAAPDGQSSPRDVNKGEKRRLVLCSDGGALGAPDIPGVCHQVVFQLEQEFSFWAKKHNLL